MLTHNTTEGSVNSAASTNDTNRPNIAPVPIHESVPDDELPFDLYQSAEQVLNDFQYFEDIYKKDNSEYSALMKSCGDLIRKYQSSLSNNGFSSIYTHAKISETNSKMTRDERDSRIEEIHNRLTKKGKIYQKAVILFERTANEFESDPEERKLPCCQDPNFGSKIYQTEYPRDFSRDWLYDHYTNGDSHIMRLVKGHPKDSVAALPFYKKFSLKLSKRLTHD